MPGGPDEPGALIVVPKPGVDVKICEVGEPVADCTPGGIRIRNIILKEPRNPKYIDFGRIKPKEPIVIVPHPPGSTIKDPIKNPDETITIETPTGPVIIDSVPPGELKFKEIDGKIELILPDGPDVGLRVTPAPGKPFTVEEPTEGEECQSPPGEEEGKADTNCV